MSTLEAERVAGPCRSRSARDAQTSGYGNDGYWQYLDQSAQEHHDYFMARGAAEMAELMFTRTLSESLMGNEGD